MNFVSSLLAGTAKGIGKSAIGGTSSRAFLGAGVGGLYQAATTDQEQTTNYLSAIGKGALAGALLGGASRLVTPGFVGGQLRKPELLTGRNFVRTAKASVNLANMGMKAAVSTTSFALRHPMITLGAIGGGYALANQTSSPIYSSDIYQRGTNYNQQLMQSTQGLVQGMHRGRH